MDSPVTDSSSSSEAGDSETESTTQSKKNQYTGTHPEMKYLKRGALCMTSEEFSDSGKQLLKREYVLDLRFPEAENTVEATGDLNESEFDAIRLNSWPILKALAKLPNLSVAENYSQRSVPYVFWAPFSVFVENLGPLQEHLKKLKGAASNKVREAAVALVPPSVCDAPDSEPAQHHKQREESDEEWEINDLEYFINFVKETLKNDLEQQRRFQSNEEDEVAFTDLHNLFRLHSESYVAGYFEGSIRAFQLMGACGRDVQRNKSESRRQPKQDELRSGFMLILSYWDFNGSGFCAVRRDVTITPFIGRLPIRNLQVFPMNYLLSEEIQLLQKRGRKFLQYAEMQAQGHGLHRYYVGLSLNHIQGSKEDIDGEVIIDHSLAIQHNSEWEPNTDLGDLSTLLESYTHGTHRVSRRDHASAWTYSRASSNQAGLIGGWVMTRNARFFLGQNSKVSELCSGAVKEAAERMRETKFLVHVRVFAFFLRSRKWVQVDIDKVKKVISDRNGFDSLVLPSGHKELVQALVKMHSQGPKSSATQKIDQVPQMDLVRGKGKGLILLLHGAPGVGKTSTAECVAAYAGRPLFPITCGDIGYEPKDVETNLENNFRLAHNWGCVLLLDEADVFLGRRDRHDLKRNSLVSVFLRVLEYYSGILFLTTNRVGTFDEAFKSRIHISLYYPALDLQAYISIWDMNIRRLGELKNDVMIDRDNILFFANNYYERLRWNGRQIRNAFQTAFALAEYQATFCENPSGVRTILNANHFEAVANAAMAFDGYLTDIYGGHDDSDRAKHDQIRVDHWRGAQAGVGQAAQPWGPTAAPNWGSSVGQSWGSSTGGPWPAQGGGPGPTQFWPSHTTPASAQQVSQTALNPTPTQFAQNPPKPWTPAPYPTQIPDINPVQASDNSRILGLNPLSGAGGPVFGQGTSNANPATAGTEQDNSRNEYSDEDF